MSITQILGEKAILQGALKSMSSKIDPNTLQRIKVVAHKRGLSSSALIRYFLSKGLESELRK